MYDPSIGTKIETTSIANSVLKDQRKQHVYTVPLERRPKRRSLLSEILIRVGLFVVLIMIMLALMFGILYLV